MLNPAAPNLVFLETAYLYAENYFSLNFRPISLAESGALIAQMMLAKEFFVYQGLLWHPAEHSPSNYSCALLREDWVVDLLYLVPTSRNIWA